MLVINTVHAICLYCTSQKSLFVLRSIHNASTQSDPHLQLHLHFAEFLNVKPGGT